MGTPKNRGKMKIKSCYSIVFEGFEILASAFSSSQESHFSRLPNRFISRHPNHGSPIDKIRKEGSGVATETSRKENVDQDRQANPKTVSPIGEQ